MKRNVWICAVVLKVTVLAAGCAGIDRQIGDMGQARLFEGMGSHARRIQTVSAQAQRFFNQGLVWAYAFNHDEAIRSFEAAADLDPDCAMAWWGIALCNGPHINNPAMDDDRSRAAWAALQKAMAVVQGRDALESELIAALAERYADPPPQDRRSLDEAYAAAMGTVYRKYSNDADIGTLYAESLMDLQPWDLWDKDGTPKGRTRETMEVLEKTLALDPRHPGACHLYIHAMEASPEPEKADAAATVLRDAVPASSHLVHMPSHIDVQLGRWSLAADQNARATEVDRRYQKLSPKQGFYRVYMAHNTHFLAFASMMEGRSKVALQAARDMIAGVPPDFLAESSALIDPYMMIALDVLKRFGRWDELLKEPKPAAKLPITMAFWHFSRGVAYAAKGRIDQAEHEQAEFRAAVMRVPQDAMMAINPAHKVLSIAEHMLEGEIAFRHGELQRCIDELNKGIAIEDDLMYMEPPEWIQPVRHTLGAVLTHAQRFKEAEQVYRRDLQIWPENGWSLHGLARSLKAQGNAEEAKAVEQRFARTWRRADVKITASCLCIPGT